MTIIFAYLFFFTGAIADAQPLQLSFQNFSIDRGLSDNHVTSFFRDSRGFLWISTVEGLNRFDGSIFRTFYEGNDPSSLPSNFITSIIEYKKDFLLIGTTKGLCVMNTIDQEFYPIKDTPLISKPVYSIWKEENGYIWVSFAKAFALLDNNLKCIHYMEMGVDFIEGINGFHRIKDGTFIISTHKGYFIVNEKNWAITPLQEQFSETGKIECVLVSFYDAEENLLYSSCYENGFSIIDFNNKTVRTITPRRGCEACLSEGIITAFTKDSDGNIWMGSHGGIIYFNKSKNTFTTYRHLSDETTSLISDHVSSLYMDNENDLWIGTYNGMSKLSSRSKLFTHFKKEFELNGNKAELYGISKSMEGKLYVATYGNGVFAVNPDTKKVDHITKTPIAHAWSVRADNGFLTITGHEKRIFRLKLNTLTPIKINFLQPFYSSASNLVLFEYADSRGDSWYSINGGQGLVRHDNKENKFYHYSNKDHPQPFSHNYFNAVTEDKKGNLWFGVNRKSELVCYDAANNSFRQILVHEPSGTPISGITSLLCDKKGTVWIGTEGSGLIQYDPEKGPVRFFTINDGLPGNNITSLAFDKKGRLWLGTQKGLGCLLPGYKILARFSRTDGLPEIYFNDNVSVYDSAANKMYMGTQYSLVEFDPDALLKNIPAYVTAFVDVLFINNKKCAFHDKPIISVPYSDNNLQFVFSAIDMNSSQDIFLMYKLNGADNDWIQAGNKRTATYPNLKAGNYKMKLRARHYSNEKWNESEMPLTIKINPAWWQTWWFLIAVGLLLMGLLMNMVRFYYRKKLEKQKLLLEKHRVVEKERTRIAADIHDDLGAGLTRIKFITENISEKIQPDNTVKTELEKLKNSTSQLIESMAGIIWAMNEKNNLLSDTLYYLRSYAVNYCEENSMECLFEIPNEFNDQIVGGNIRRNLFLLLKECLHNIIKHARAKIVKINISVTEKLELLIKDDGIGFTEAIVMDKGNGIINMKKRVEELNGVIKLENSNGTKVTIQLPLATNQSAIG